MKLGSTLHDVIDRITSLSIQYYIAEKGTYDECYRLAKIQTIKEINDVCTYLISTLNVKNPTNLKELN